MWVTTIVVGHKIVQNNHAIGHPQHLSSRIARRIYYSISTTTSMAPKEGVASLEELQAFVQEAGDRLRVVDVRNPDASVEPGDQKSIARTALPSASHRPQALNLVWDQSSESMPLPDIAKDTPIITHCGAGARGQKAKEFLLQNGFTNVLNGGGPKETERWNEFGDK